MNGRECSFCHHRSVSRDPCDRCGGGARSPDAAPCPHCGGPTYQSHYCWPCYYADGDRRSTEACDDPSCPKHGQSALAAVAEAEKKLIAEIEAVLGAKT